MKTPSGYKLVRLRYDDGRETLVLIEDEFEKRVRLLAEGTEPDRSIVLEPIE